MLCLGHKLGHLTPIVTKGILMLYFISRPTKKSSGRTVYYMLLMVFIILIFYFNNL